MTTSSLPSSSERSSSSAQLQMELKEGMESDDDIRRVPDYGGGVGCGGGGGGASTSNRGENTVETWIGGSQAASEAATGNNTQRKRGRTPADKEHKRLKRLLRNRVSAQQARERKKAYLTDLEGKVNDLEKKNSQLEEKLSTLQNENQMLRHILKNTTRRGSSANVNANEESSIYTLIHTNLLCFFIFILMTSNEETSPVAGERKWMNPVLLAPNFVMRTRMKPALHSPNWYRHWVVTAIATKSREGSPRRKENDTLELAAVMVVHAVHWNIGTITARLWLLSVICEIWFAVSWVLDQHPKWTPMTRKTNVDVLRARFWNEDEPCTFDPIDVLFVSTVDPMKKLPLVTANTVLSILAVDYPIDKAAN